GLGDITEYPTSEWGDELIFGDEDDIEEELNLKTTAASDLPSRNYSSRPDTNKSTSSQLRRDSKRIRLKYSHPPVVNFAANNLKRDPSIEYLIESHKSNVIENSYTRLAQATSHVFRPTYTGTNSVRPRFITSKSDNSTQVEKKTERKIDSTIEDKLPFASIVEFETETWDEGLNNEIEREENLAKNKSSLLVYEETCKHFNISMCSMILRSLNTTKINLANYGLGPKGTAALTVALLRNTSVQTLNLAGNNIGDSGMSYIYQILTENSYIENYDLSYNNLGGKGLGKLAAGAIRCVQLKYLNIAGNGLTGGDIDILLTKLDDHLCLRTLNLSHNQLDERGGIAVGKWLCDNHVLLSLDVSWCSIRLLGAQALAKAIGENNKLTTLDLSNNRFTNETLEPLTDSLMRNMVLKELNLSGNQIFCGYSTQIKENPSILIDGNQSSVYDLLAAAMTNQVLKIFRLGKNHLDTRCVMIILEALVELDEISLEELDLTGLTLTSKQNLDMQKLFPRHSQFKCYVDPIKQTIEPFANHLLHAIHTYCTENDVTLKDVFVPLKDEQTVITYDQFCESLRKARIPIPTTQIENIMKYLGREDDEGMISMRRHTMNEPHTNNHSMCNQNQILKTLPLKKRRTYLIDSSITNDEQNENDCKTNNPSFSRHDRLLKHVPLSPPSSPHIELLRQQYPYFPASSLLNQPQNYQYPFAYGNFPHQQRKCSCEGETIDEHFRKSFAGQQEHLTYRCFTPDDSSSNSSATEQTSADSIEEHFARSLAKFQLLNQDELTSVHRQKTESIVDDHFAKALGTKTWEKLKDKC
ncbi:unnamed protein product, partial [Adineta ricciae]